MTTLLSPFDLSDADQQSGRTFRKQILKKGTITYQGRQIVFDDAFCQEAVKAFHGGAYDQVPFVLADMSNRHNMDPERYRGEIVDMEVTPDGVDGIFKTTKAGARAIESNPKLGVSARIVQGLEKVDGRKYKLAIQHVLATMDPRLTGMRPWEAVNLAAEEDDDDEVLDLTTSKIREGTRVGTKTAKRRPAVRGEVQTLDLSKLDDDTFEIVLAAMTEESATDTDDDETVEEVTSKQTVKRKGFRKQQDAVDPDEDEDLEEDDELNDEEDEDLEEDSVEDEEDEEDEEEAPVTKKSKKKVPAQRKQVQLSVPIKRRKVSKARRLELELAEERWANKKTELIDAGVPPALINLAEPLMKQPDRLVIDLSETGDRTVDAKAVLGRVLEEVKGMIDLSVELGHGVSRVERDDKGNLTDARLSAWDAEYGQP